MILTDIFELVQKSIVTKAGGSKYTLTYKDKYGNAVKLICEGSDYDKADIGDELDPSTILKQTQIR